MNDVHHLPQLIRGSAVILLGTFGIAAVTAWMLTSTGEAGVIFALDKLRAPVDPETHIPPARTKGDIHRKVKCDECGVVESTLEVEQLGEGIDLATAGGGMVGSWNGISGKPTKSYEVTIRMKDGSSRVFIDTTPVNWRPGQRVIVIGGESR